jgi:hypothetical protein
MSTIQGVSGMQTAVKDVAVNNDCPQFCALDRGDSESSQDHDRGSGSQAADRSVAAGAGRRDTGGCRHAPGLKNATCAPVRQSPYSFGSIRTVVTGCR